MSKNESLSNNITDLKKELDEMHRLFDNINIEKTLKKNIQKKDNDVIIKKTIPVTPILKTKKTELENNIDTDLSVKITKIKIGSNLNKSFLSIVDNPSKLKKTKIKKVKKSLKSVQQIGAKKTTALVIKTEKKNKASNILTIIILTLMLLILIGIYIMF